MSNNLLASNPIGIFDSGIGGLTVANAVTRLLPQENIIYFGDTAHLPYGDKSSATIQRYTLKIADFLLAQRCKLILIACNSASSVAYQLLQEYVADQALVIDVINPTINYVSQHYSQQTIGLIGTQLTVSSQAYPQRFIASNSPIQLQSLATPLLVPMIEAGFAENKIVNELIDNYLGDPMLVNINALILACTHYPLIKDPIKQYYHTRQQQVMLIDSADVIAQAVLTQLQDVGLLNQQKMTAFRKFYLSDYTSSFAETAKIFFSGDVDLQDYPLWQSE